MLHKRISLYFVFSLVILLLFIFSIHLGSVSIPFEEVIKSLLRIAPAKTSWEYIIWDFRLPKALTAMLAGSGLAISGLLMQTLFRNPLAGPFVLGISNGAGLGVALLIMLGSWFWGSFALPGNWALVLASVAGSLGILFLVLGVSSKVRDNVSLLIVGLMVGSATGAIVSVLQYFSDAEVVQAFLIWTFGSLSGVNWGQLGWLTPLVLSGIILALMIQKQLNAFLLGEAYSRGLGISVQKHRTLIILATCLLAGSITAFCGPIAFIGIAVPHLARTLFRTSNHAILIPATGLMGCLLMLTCDIIAQLPGHQETLPINAVTALFGSPVVIWVVIRSRNRFKSSF